MNATWQIRKLGPEDAESWAAVRFEALTSHPLAFGASPPATLEELAESIRPRLTSSEFSIVFGAFDGPKLIGIVGIAREPERKKRHKARIWGMYVALSHRRLGIGELLLNAAIQQAQSWQGIEQVVLSVTEVADDARRLYERAGFRAWGREPRALYSDGLYADETYMIRHLADA